MPLSRRGFLGAASAALGAGTLKGGTILSAVAAPSAPNLPGGKEHRLAKLEAFQVPPRSVFVRIETDGGLVGWGEGSLEGRAATQVTAIEEFRRYLIGQNPFEIERHWQAMYRGDFYHGGPVLTSAISGIDQALWDLLGKALGQPVHQLLGGRARDRIKVYCGIGGGSPESAKESIQGALSRGFRAGKMGMPETAEILDGMEVIKSIYNQVKWLREAAPDDFDILIDFHGKLAPAMAISVIDALTELRPFFVEEPILPENVDALVRVAHSVKVPIATGERIYTKFGFREILEKQAVAVVQPDCCHAGGITEVKKIAAMAEAYSVGVAPHNPLHALSTAACLQIDACSPNFLIQEQGNLGEGLLQEPFVVKDGYIEVPTGPGMGVEIDEERLAQLRTEWKDWETPRLWHKDGGVADW